MWKTKGLEIKITIFQIFLAVVLFLFFAAFLEFATEGFVYIESYLQYSLFYAFHFISFFLLINFLWKKERIKALLAFLLPILIYSLINYTIEAVMFGTQLYEQRDILSSEEFAQRNITLSLADLKIVLTVLSLIAWCWVWKKL